jgi:uncharacterized repeat protein (TIGR02543 family)
VSPGSKPVTQGEIYGELPIPTRTGYIFEGWHSAVSGGGTKITETNVVTLSVAHTLYAYWTANTYTVTFEAQGGAVSPESKLVTFGISYGDLPTPTREGWLFEGWYDAPSGGKVVKSLSPAVTADDHTLYAYWTDVPPSYLTSDLDSAEPAAITTTYDGFLYDTDNTVRGTVTLNAKAAVKWDKTKTVATTNWTFSAKAVMQTATVSFSGKREGALGSLTLPGKRGESLAVTLGADTFHGTYTDANGTLNVAGARNAFADKLTKAAAQERQNAVLGLYNVALENRVGQTFLSVSAAEGAAASSASGTDRNVCSTLGYLTLSVGKAGVVKVAGVLSDGSKFSGSAKLLEGLNEDGWHCVALHRPLYSKKGFVGGLLWLDPVENIVRVDSLYGWLVDWVCEDAAKAPNKAAFAEQLDVFGGYFGDGKSEPCCSPSVMTERLLSANVPDDLPPPVASVAGWTGNRWMDEAFPWELPVTFSSPSGGIAFPLPKATAPVKDKGTGLYVYDGLARPS